MAYGAILGQNPNLSAYAKKEGLPVSDIRELTIRDGESISAGDVVNVGAESDGQPDAIYKDVTPQDNVENVIQNISVGAKIGLAKINQNYSAAALSTFNGNYYYGYVKLLDSEGNAISQSQSFNTYTYVDFSIARLDDTRFAIQYGSTIVRVATISGTSLTLGTEYDIADSTLSLGNALISLSDSLVFSVYARNGNQGLHVKISSINGTTVNAGVEYSVPGIASANYISACRLPDEGGNKRVCICFSDTGDGNKGKAVIATIDSSNAVTFGDVVTFTGNNSNFVTCAYANGYVYGLFNTSGVGNIVPIFDSNFTFVGLKSPVQFGTFALYNPYAAVLENKIVTISRQSDNGMKARVITVDGLQCTPADEYKASDNIAHQSVAAISDNKVIVAYANVANSSYGTTTILTVEGNQIAGSFIDNSQDAIALADGTGGQEIPVGFGGYCECPGVTEGEQITSDGVNAFSPLGGWLKIFSVADQSMYPKFFSGLYTGNGSTMTINVGKKPYILFCHQTGGNGNTIISSVVGGTINFRGSYLDTAPTVTFTDTGVRISKEFSNKSYKYKYIILA